MDRAVFHICARAAYAAAQPAAYHAASLEREGFTHLSQAHQVLPTARAYFNGVPDLVVLVIDPTRLSSRLVYEPPVPIAAANNSGVPKAASVELYPHCYGPIDLAAIVDVVDLERFHETLIRE